MTLGTPRWRRTWAFLLLLEAALVLRVILLAWTLADFSSPAPTPLLQDRTGRYLAEADKDSDLGYWDLPQPLNPKVAAAVVAGEDRRFRWFPGVDPWALARALVDGTGGSTVAMQVARMQSVHPRTWQNKLLEAATGFFLVARHGHDRVLAQYLKLLPQGNRIHGVSYGARRFFHKPLDDVSWAEASLLVSLAQAPGRMNLFDGEGFDLARERARRILGLLRDGGVLEEAEYRSSVAELDSKPLPVAESRPKETYHFVLRALSEDQAHGQLTVTKPRSATLDPRVQDVTWKAVRRLYEDYGAYAVGNVAALVADRRSGDVLAYVGSAAYFDGPSNGAIDYVQTPRSSGSTLKPLVYALALDERTVTPATVLADLPFAILDPKGVYRPGNFDDAFMGPMLFRRALGNSRNIPALRVLEGLGLERTYRRLADLGLVREARGADWYGYGLVLGGLYVSLEDLVRTYGTLANGGKELPLRYFTDEPAESRRRLSEYAARTVAQALSDETARVPSFPRGSALDFPWPVAIKTGTSQGYRDAWAVAFDDQYVLGVWMGDADNIPMNHVAGQIAAGGVHEILEALEPLQAQGIDTVPFPRSEGAVAVEVCALSGEVAGDDCPNTSVEWFRPDEAPHRLCTVHVRESADRATGLPATPATPPDRVALRPVTRLGPEYRLWALQHGLVPAAVRAVPSLKIQAPIHQGIYVRDPETPVRFQTLALQALVSAEPPSIDWYVDGQFYTSAAPPYTVRWPMVLGFHTIEARWPGVSDLVQRVSIEVR